MSIKWTVGLTSEQLDSIEATAKEYEHFHPGEPLPRIYEDIKAEQEHRKTHNL